MITVLRGAPCGLVTLERFKNPSFLLIYTFQQLICILGEGRELGEIQADEREQNFLGGTSGETLSKGPYHLLPFALP